MYRRLAVPLTSSSSSSSSSHVHTSRRLFSFLFRSSSSSTATSYPPAGSKNGSVRRWLFASSALVGAVVCVGGITRLTESGLSIVEWRPVTGVIPPLSAEAWEAEFAKYRTSPEFAQRSNMTVEEFKMIFFWEWAHRVLARSIGLVYGVPLVYFWSRGVFGRQTLLKASLVGLLAMGGGQGAMGWYMVKSGLDPKIVEEKRKATVSAFRLAAHLTLAFLIYAGMMRISFGLGHPVCQGFRGKVPVQLVARASFSLMFVTAISGAFVAGHDAGLLYNDGFPFMAGGVFPPRDHLAVFEPWCRNLFENPCAAQLWHRLMAGTTTTSIVVLNVVARSAACPENIRRAVMAVNGALVLQVSLGIFALLSSVSIPIAAAHQAGSLLLLTKLIRLCAMLGSKGIVL